MADEKIKKYILASLDKQHTYEEIKSHLLEFNYSPSDIEEAYESIAEAELEFPFQLTLVSWWMHSLSFILVLISVPILIIYVLIFVRVSLTGMSVPDPLNSLLFNKTISAAGTLAPALLMAMGAGLMAVSYIFFTAGKGLRKLTRKSFYSALTGLSLAAITASFLSVRTLMQSRWIAFTVIAVCLILHIVLLHLLFSQKKLFIRKKSTSKQSRFQDTKDRDQAQPE